MRVRECTAVVRVFGMVDCTPDFERHPEVMDDASARAGLLAASNLSVSMLSRVGPKLARCNARFGSESAVKGRKIVEADRHRDFKDAPN